jgi:DNA-binding transcriptional LysR family regulator
MVSSENCVSVLPVSVLKLHAKKLHRLPFVLPMPRWPVVMVTLKNRTPNPAAALFVECVIDVTGSDLVRCRL